jgi:hypothetical protein
VRLSTNATRTLDEYPDIMSAADIAGYLHISRRRTYELFQIDPSHGGIPCITIGTSKRVKKESFSRWLDKLERQA